MRTAVVVILATLSVLAIFAQGQKCRTHRTGYSDSGNGNLVYLDRQRVNCGHDRSALSSFKMETKHYTTTHKGWWGRRKTKHHQHIRHRYTCCSFTPYYCGFNKEIKNAFTPDGRGDAVYLDRQPVNCGNRGILNDFRLERNRAHNHIRYHYYCCKVRPEYKMSCYNKRTHFSYDGDGKLWHLDRQNVRCKYGHFLSYFRLERNSAHDSWRYSYRCCRIHGAKGK